MKSIVSVLIIATAAQAFTPTTPIHTKLSPTQSTALHATPQTQSETSRRSLLTSTLSNAFLLTGLTSTITTQSASATTTLDDYAISIEQSTTLLSQSLTHALLSIDGLNTQARRLNSSPSSGYTHTLAVIDGMNAQARRLIHDLSTSEELLSSIQSKSRQITISDESYSQLSTNVAHATSILDGLMSQSKRLVSASTAGERGYSGDEQVVYLLSVLDGLNAQARRLEGGEVLGVLDELNSKAAKALL